MKRITTYLVIAKLLTSIYLLVARQRFYLVYRKLQNKMTGRRVITST